MLSGTAAVGGGASSNSDPAASKTPADAAAGAGAGAAVGGAAVGGGTVGGGGGSAAEPSPNAQGMYTLDTLKFDNRTLKRLPLDREPRNFIREVGVWVFVGCLSVVLLLVVLLVVGASQCLGCLRVFGVLRTQAANHPSLSLCLCLSLSVSLSVSLSLFFLSFSVFVSVFGSLCVHVHVDYPQELRVLLCRSFAIFAEIGNFTYMYHLLWSFSLSLSLSLSLSYHAAFSLARTVRFTALLRRFIPFPLCNLKVVYNQSFTLSPSLSRSPVPASLASSPPR